MASEAGPAGCTIITKYQRQVTQSPVAINGYGVVHLTQNNVLVPVRISSPSSMGPVADVVYDFRSDQPGSAPNVSTLNGGMNGMPIPLSMVGATRRADNMGTLILATDNMTPWLFNWPDMQNSAPTPTPGSNFGARIGGGLLLDTPTGLFYAVGDDQGSMNNTCPPAATPCGTFLDWEPNDAPPSFRATGMLDNIPDHSLGDSGGARAYALSDGSVSLLYDYIDPSNPNVGQLGQAQVPSGSATSMSTRIIAPQGGIPLVFAKNGSNVDIGIVLPGQDDAGNPRYDTYLGTIPESQVFTFDIQKDLKAPGLFDALGIDPSYMGPPPCWASAPGKLVMMIPAGANPGLNTIAIDVTQATVPVSMLNGSNLLNSDTQVNQCSLSFASISQGQYWFDLVWSDNAGNGQVTLNYAPLVCTIP
jgi:hypothetical protein